jgi:hypothetical protein
VQRGDHAEHGAEQPDERGVVAEGGEDDQVLLVALPDPRLLRAHRLGGGVDPVVARLDPRDRDPGGERVAAAEPRVERVRLAAADRRDHRLLDRVQVDLAPAQEQHALDHHADRQHRQGEQEPQHPLGAQQGEAYDLIGQVHDAPVWAVGCGEGCSAFRIS